MLQSWSLIRVMKLFFLIINITLIRWNNYWTTLQNYLQNLCNRGEISKAEFDQIRPNNAKPARAHGLPKIYKTFTNIPKFRPIIDTTGSSHYLVGRYLAQLCSLTNNEFTLRDSFKAVNSIQYIPSSLFVNGYKYVSFNVESLFTNVPIKKTISVILTQIYNDHAISTHPKSHSHKKLVFIQ